MKSTTRYAFFVALLSLFFPLKVALAQITFDPSVNYETGTINTTTGNPCPVPLKSCFTLNNPSSIAVGDFNNDGKLDLAVINGLPVKVGLQYKFYLSVRLGDGLGGFGDPEDVFVREIGGLCPSNTKNLIVCDRGTFLFKGDFNGDGNDDLAVVYFGNPTASIPVPGKVGIFLSNGDGTFQDPTFVEVGLGAVRAVVGQFTSSGHLDIAVANREADTVSILLGDGFGGFTVPGCNGAPACAVGKKPVSLAAGHFNSDGKLDLAVVNGLDDNVSLLKGDGLGGFTGFTGPTPETVSVGTQPIAIVVGNFGGDANLDLAVLDQQTKAVTFLFGNGAGHFEEGGKKLQVGRIPVDMIADDFNGDSALDLAVVFFPGKLGAVFPGVGDTTFGRPAQLKSTGGGIGNFALASGDFDGDGKPDIAIANGKFSVQQNETPFPSGVSVTVISPNGGGPPLTIGSTQTITWSTVIPGGFPFGSARIDLSTDGGATFKTIKTVANTGTLSWKVPGPATTTALIRVCSGNYPGICDTSDATFTIQ